MIFLKNLVFNQNEFLIKNNFSTVLKRAVNTMVFEYLEDICPTPHSFEEFDKEISNLIIKLQEEQEDFKKKKSINKFKKTTVHFKKSKKFIK